MKRWTRRPENAVCRIISYRRFLPSLDLWKVEKSFNRRVIWRQIVADASELLIAARTVAAKNKILAWIVVVRAFGCRNGCLVCRGVIYANSHVRAQFTDEKNQKKRRQNASSCFFLQQNKDRISHDQLQSSFFSNDTQDENLSSGIRNSSCTTEMLDRRFRSNLMTKKPQK